MKKTGFLALSAALLFSCAGGPVPRPPAQEQIIAEIVARDIEKLCRGNILVTGNRLKD